MSLNRQVKTLFTLSSLIFTYIIWVAVSSIILKNSANFTVYLISLCSVFFMQYLILNGRKTVLQVLLPIIGAIIINGLIFDLYSAEYNSLYIFFTLIFFRRFENEEINYELYKSIIQRFIYTLIFLGLVIPLLSKELAQEVFRFYLVYLISAIIVLRETRKYSSRISDKKSLVVNLAIVFSVLLISMDKIYNLVTMIFNYAWLKVNFALDKIIMVIAYIAMYLITKPFNFIAAFIQRLMTKYLVMKKPLVINDKKDLKGLPEILEKDSNNTFIFLFVLILKIIIVIIILYLIFKVFNIYVKKSSYDEGEVQKEKIFRIKRNNKQGKLSKLIKIFKGKMDLKVQILNVYLKFEKSMSDKEIYKIHMTAGQLSSMAKTQIDDIESINSITSIYNEAKFSNHEVSEKNAKMAKANYESLRKKI